MTQTLAIAAGGAAGAVARYWVSNGVYGLLGRDFPYGTLAVNVLGSLAMGFVYVLLLERVLAAAELRGLLLVGFLGAFTTFSTFSLETLNLIEQAAHLKAVTNVLVSVLVCILAAALGVWLGRAV